MAWDFLNNNVYEDGGIERPPALPDRMPHGFQQDYERHIRGYRQKTRVQKEGR